MVAIPADLEVILQRAEGQLAEGNPKRAREGFRRLFKMDPDRFRDRYLEVTSQVIELRLSEGKPKEADQLLRHLKEIGATAAQLGALPIRIATALGERGMAAEAAVGFLESKNAAERIEAADALVLARAERAAPVCASISHLCRGEWDQMKEALKEIGRGSPFAHWRLFLRGCAAHYRGDRDEAERCFKRLPEGSVPARKSRAFEVLSGKWQGMEERTIVEACLLSGERKLAKCLPATQKKWLSGRFSEAYQVLKRSRASFPGLEVTPWGQLTRFFQFADCNMTSEQGRDWVEALLHLLPPGGRAKPNSESYLVSNVLLRCTAGLEYQGDIQGVLWPLFIASRERLLGSSARFVAMCHFLRALHHEPDEDHPWYFSGRRRGDFEPMIQTLKSAIKADASFQEPPLQLLKIYRHLRRWAEANRLLDEMTKRFPDSQEVLLAAGRGCLDRKAYVKGLDYLERARKVDPVDPGIQAEIRRGLREKAAAHFRKGSEAQVAKGRETFARLLASVPHHPAPGESRGFLLIQWSVLEEIAASGPDAPLAREKFAEAGQEVSADVAEFYRALQRQVLGAPPRSGSRKLRQVFLPAPSRGKAELQQAVQICELWKRFEEHHSGFLPTPVIGWIAKYARAATGKLRREDRDLVLQLVTLLTRGGFLWEDLAAEIITKQLKTDPRDPHLLCLAWICRDQRPPTAAERQKARDEAVKRRDRAALQAIKSFEEMEARRAEQFGGGGPFGDVSFDDEDEDEDEDEFFDGEGDDPDEMPDHVLEELLKLSPAQRIAELTRQGVDRARAELVSGMIEMLAVARRGAPPKTPPRKRAASKNKPRGNTAQIDLPF